MSLLDKQEVQEHTALLARKFSGFICTYVNERQKIGHYRARSTEERRRRMPNRHFYFARCVRKLRYYSDVIHSFDWKSAIEQDGGVLLGVGVR